MPAQSHSFEASEPCTPEPLMATQHKVLEPAWPLPNEYQMSSDAIALSPGQVPSQQSHHPSQPHRIVDEDPPDCGVDCNTPYIDPTDSTLKPQAPPLTPPVSVSTTSNNGNSEEKVVVPLAKLQQLVQFCAEILRESHESEPDLERGERESQHLHIELHSSLTNTKLSSIFAWPGIGPDDPRHKPIMEIWDEVQPFQLTRVPVLGTLNLDSSSGCADYRTVDDLYMGGGGGAIAKEDRASALAWRVMRYKVWYLEWSSILIVCCYSFAKNPDCSIGDVLYKCYQHEILAQPESLNPEDYLNHIQSITKSLLILNFVFSCSGLLPIPERYPSSIISSVFNERPESLMGLRISALFRMLQFAYPDYGNAELDCAGGSTLRIDDLSIKSLHSIGNLSIIWTDVVEDHLKLDLNNMTLSVIWEPQYSDSSLMGQFQKSLAKSREINPTISQNSGKLHNLQRSASRHSVSSSDENEIRRTWAILFATDHSPKERISAYDQLEPPPWSSMGTPKFAEAYRNLHLGTDKSIRGRLTRADMEAVREAALDKRPLQYSRFPIFETRLRQLRYWNW